MARHGARDRICETAVRLFNEQGYDAVSLRQIAAEAGTTIGNLTYHFSRKEDLLAAVLVDLHKGFSERLDRSLGGADLMSRLVSLIRSSEENHDRFPFYFDNLSQLMASFPSLGEENDAFATEIFDYYLWAFSSLGEDGWFVGMADAETVEAFSYALVMMQSGWSQASSPYRNDLLPTLSLADTVLRLLRSHVSDGRLAEFDAICA